jgi:hypothetical protein
MARQAARLLRQTTGRKDEEVALITSADLERLNACQWLKANRDGWGIESGLHQRLDISYNDDRCRVQSDKAIWIFGMFRRLANSLFMEWRQAQRRPEHLTTTDFQALLASDNRRRALRFISTQKPSLSGLS